MSPGNFKPNLSSNRSIRFSAERGVPVQPAGEGVLLPKPMKQPQSFAKSTGIPKLIQPKQKKMSGRRYYGEV